MSRQDNLWFSFNGTSSADMGLRVLALPDVQIAEARGRAVEIPGRDGALWLSDDSFKPVTHRIAFEIGGDADIDAVAAWLSGGGKLVLSSFPDYYWRARIIKGFDLQSGIYAGGNCRTEVAFSCEPFRYQVGDPSLPAITAARAFSGGGTWPAKPVITVHGSGSMNLLVNGATVLLDDIAPSITLDCDAMMAFKGNVNASPQVTILSDDGAWPTLVPGINTVSWSSVAGAAGSITSVVITPNWRWR